MLEQSNRFFILQAGVFQCGSFPLGEMGMAGAAVEHANPLATAAPAPKAQIPFSAKPIDSALRVLATENLDRLHDTLLCARYAAQPLNFFLPCQWVEDNILLY
jgi:hypothetical protein